VTKETGKESILASAVVAWLNSDGWDVYQEVKCQGRTADIVAVLGSVIWVIECKSALTFAVLEQAWRWADVAHMRSVAIPGAKRGDKGRFFAEHVAARYGIGVLTVKGENVFHKSGEFGKKPPSAFILREALRPEHKLYAPAGSPSTFARWTPFRGTVDGLKRFLTNNPGATMKEIVASVKHHYKSDAAARRALPTWINEGVIRGVRAEREGTAATKFYLEAHE
jgi:hypothetical protein